MAAFTVIDHTEIGSGGAASWSVTSIPSSYDHLLLKMSARGAAGGTVALTLNSDTGSNYSETVLRVVSNSLNSYRWTAQTSLGFLGPIPTSTMTTSTFGSHEYWIPHFTNTSGYKQVIQNCIQENNSTVSNAWQTAMVAGLWQNTAAVTAITMTSTGGGSGFAQYSTFTLYGITGA